MIVGSGMLAQNFRELERELPEIWIHAAGVSNSACHDSFEYARDKQRLIESLTMGRDARTFVYFSTCSVYDSHSRESQYVLHKASMERMVLVRHDHPLVI